MHSALNPLPKLLTSLRHSTQRAILKRRSARLSLHMSVSENLASVHGMSPAEIMGNSDAMTWGVGSMAASGGGIAAGASKLPTIGPVLPRTNSPHVAKPLTAAPAAATAGGGREGAVIAKKLTVRIGRWMSKKEYEAMKKTGKVQDGAGDSTYGSTSGPESFGSQAKPGSVYVEYDVPSASVLQGSKPDWVLTVGPNANSMQRAQLLNQGGQFSPSATNISGILGAK